MPKRELDRVRRTTAEYEKARKAYERAAAKRLDAILAALRSRDSLGEIGEAAGGVTKQRIQRMRDDAIRDALATGATSKAVSEQLGLPLGLVQRIAKRH